MTEIEAVVQKLHAADVRFTVAHEGPNGEVRIALSVDEVPMYMADPVAFFAKFYRVTGAEYLGWHASNFCVMCAGVTAKGRPCKSSVTGLTRIENPGVWAGYRDQYCCSHGGI